MRVPRFRLTAAALSPLLLILSSCSLSQPTTIDEDEIPLAVNAEQIPDSFRGIGSFFAPDCLEAQIFSEDLLENTQFVEGIEYSDEAGLGWGFTQIIFEAPDSETADRLALAFSRVKDCVGLPQADVYFVSLADVLDSSGTGIAIGQDVELGILGDLTGIKAMVSKANYLVYIDTYASSFSGWDSQGLFSLTARALD